MADIPQGERIRALEVRADAQDTAIREIRDDVKHIRTVIDRATGGWKMLVVVGTAAAAVGGAVGWLISHFKLFIGGAP